MGSFGWKAGVDYCPHLSNASTAWFACVLGMPWVEDASGAVPRLKQHTCQQGFSDWLSPWQNAPVEWLLLARDTSNPASTWTPVGHAAAATQGLQLSPAQRANLVNRCAQRLHAYVQGHPDALGQEPLGDESPVFTYPIVTPGIAHLPAYISDGTLGTSALVKVERATLPANAAIVGVPVFALSDGRAQPLMDVRPGNLIAYQGPSRSVASEVYAFDRVMVLPVNQFAHDPARPDEPHRFLSVRSRAPDRQLYATLSRQFSPLRMWLWALTELLTDDPPSDTGYTGQQFCSLFVRLLGGGEDEMEGPRSVGSIYEVALPREVYQALFDVPHAKRPDAAQQMLSAFDTWLSNDTNGQRAADLLGRLSGNLTKIGLDDYAKRVLAIAAAATKPQPVGTDVVAAASALYAALEQQQPQARAGWAAWLATVIKVVAPFPSSASVDAAIDLILEGAKAALRNATNPAGSAAGAGPAEVLEDDVLRLLNGQIDYAPQFWAVVHANAENLRAALTAAKTDFLSALVQRTRASEPKVASMLDKAYDNASTAVQQAAHEADPQADDPPLQLSFRPASGTSEHSVRGCLLALRLGVPRSSSSTEWKTRGWLTNAWAQPSLGGGDFGAELRTPSSRNAVLCDTQGSTQSDGLDEQVTVYGGVPLLAADEENTPNPSKPQLLRYVPSDQPVPPLAYGARYAGICVTVDNAGAIIEPALRGAKPGEPLEPIPESFFESSGTLSAPDPFAYLSRRPPGAPVFLGYNDRGVKQDTVSLIAAGRQPGSHHVAVLYSGAGYEKDEPAQDITLRAPSVGTGFIKRWLAADSLVAMGDSFQWEPVRTLTLAQFEALKADAARDEQLVFTHPAVAKVEISATWFTGDPTATPSPLAPDVLDWKLAHFRGSHWLQAETLKLHIEQAAGTAANLRSFKFDASGQFIDIVVPRGMQVRLEARSVIPKALIEGDVPRLHKDALVQFDPKIARPYVEDPVTGDYKSREPQVMWVESLPEVPADDDLFNFKASDFELVLPQSAAAPQALALRLKPATVRSAQWIARAQLEHKRWQWSGYPVRFPVSGALQAWLPLYAGTKDYMPALDSAGFTTKLHGGHWLLDALVMKPLPLPAVRPANHMGLVIKAVPRYEKLLSGSTLARAGLTHVFDHVPGVARPGGERVAAPVWSEAIPMPQTVTVDASNGTLAQASRGNLLVLADPLYDTADTAAFGGIAERVEFDVVATWYTSTTPPIARILESGPNPIFHGAPPPGEAQPGFGVDTLFGLTYDKAPGARVAQTGMVLRPSNTHGRWTLAKCRLRRFVLPELMLDTKLSGRVMPDGSWEGALGLRQVEQGWVPQDFVLYANQELPGAKLPGYAIKFPTAAGNFARAYLVTWHRDRWAQAEPTWRPLMRLYERRTDAAEWALKEQITPFDTGVADFEPLGKGVGALPLTHEGSATAYRIDVSDFTDSRWLTFIGSFGQEVPASRAQIEVARTGNGYSVRASAGSHMPVLGAKDDVRPSLLLIFAPQRDLMKGRIETEGGELVGVYAAAQVAGGAVSFDEAILPCTCDPAECQALLIQVQRHNVELPESVIAAGKWAQLVSGLFPAQSSQKEATMRFLPEYIGPMKILS